jgi:hypothetical protein
VVLDAVTSTIWVDGFYGGVVFGRQRNAGSTVSLDQLAVAFRAYVESTCASPSHVVEALEIFDLPDGLAEQVGELLEATECPGERGG